MIKKNFLEELRGFHGKLAEGPGGMRRRRGLKEATGKTMRLKLQGLESAVRMPDWRLTTAELLYQLPDHPHGLSFLSNLSWTSNHPFETSQTLSPSSLETPLAHRASIQHCNQPGRPRK
ncbi:MAG: hypothetical protein INF90_15830 [Roseomonas sp.]|nr:hypothetical protein [Roseomonas sp.]MCA3368011.1 hypothetical protein [Roseomonas sp.]